MEATAMLSQVVGLYAAARNTEVESLDREASLKYIIVFAALGISVSLFALGACVACGTSFLF